jgi:formiminoglutamate deiminase
VTSSYYLCEYAWLGGPTVAADVLVEVSGHRIASVASGAAGTSAGRDATRLPGLTMPGLANVHSHAFHRALRGRTQAERGTFWTWREQMYAVADRLDPDTYLALARAVYAEMVLAGITCVGEFHYLHHGRDGVPYDDPNTMGRALIEAAAEAGLRLTLLDTCYLAGGIGQPLAGPQVRFGDGSADGWASRAELLAAAVSTGTASDRVRFGAAVHSVRGVPADQIPTVADWAAGHDAPLHTHLSEQLAENDACLAAYGRTPTQVLAEAGALGRRSTAVHATHLAEVDLMLLGESGTGACFCPTTERDLADGIGPARDLVDRGSPLSLGSDSHAVVDLFEEARAVELDERLATRRRGHFTAAELLTAATGTGHEALGWPDAGALAAGRFADLVTVRLDSVRTAGAGATPETAVFAATAADVSHVVSSGRIVVADGRHTRLGDVGRALAEAISAVTTRDSR